MKTGEKLIISDFHGTDFSCEIVSFNANDVELQIIDKQKCESEPNIKVRIFQSIPKGDKLDTVIQKCTELGAFDFTPVLSSRCISRPDEKTAKKKCERWQKIAASAAEQSGRGRIPKVIVLPTYVAAVQRAAEADLSIMFYENERATTLRMALESSAYQSVSLMSGPEGGLEGREVEQAEKQGLKVCTLGKRILRCETAPLCALSAVMYDAGEF